MIKVLMSLIFILSSASVVSAQFGNNYEVDDCYIYAERRIQYRGSDICVQELNCGIRDELTGTAVRIEKQAICPTQIGSTRCPTDGAECLADQRLSQAAVKGIYSIIRNQYRDGRIQGGLLECPPVNNTPEPDYRLRGVQGTSD